MLISNRTTIDCNQFDIEILKNVFFCWYFKQKQNEGEKTEMFDHKKTKR